MLGSAINSVLAQTFNDWELIVVDDGSTDNTADLVKSFTDHRIRYHHQPNQGRSTARNNGIGLSQGEYICFLDSDDRYLPEHLEVLHKTISSAEHKVGAFYTMVIEERDGQKRKVEQEQYRFERMIDHLLVNPIMTSRLCVHRDILKEEQFDPALSVGEDRELLARIATRYPVIEVPEWTVVYTEHEERTVSQNQEANLKHNIRLVNRMIRQHRQHISSKAARLARADAWHGLGRHYHRTGQWWKEMLWFLRAFLVRPGHRWKNSLHLLTHSRAEA